MQGFCRPKPRPERRESNYMSTRNVKRHYLFSDKMCRAKTSIHFLGGVIVHQHESERQKVTATVESISAIQYHGASRILKRALSGIRYVRGCRGAYGYRKLSLYAG